MKIQPPSPPAPGPADYSQLGPIGPLMANPRVSEIMVMGVHDVYIEVDGKVVLTPINFSTEDELMAVIRHMGVPVAGEAVRVYITLMRSIPLIMVLFWFFFLVPLLLGHLTGIFFGLAPAFRATCTARAASAWNASSSHSSKTVIDWTIGVSKSQRMISA